MAVAVSQQFRALLGEAQEILAAVRPTVASPEMQAAIGTAAGAVTAGYRSILADPKSSRVVETGFEEILMRARAGALPGENTIGRMSPRLPSAGAAGETGVVGDGRVMPMGRAAAPSTGGDGPIAPSTVTPTRSAGAAGGSTNETPPPPPPTAVDAAVGGSTNETPPPPPPTAVASTAADAAVGGDGGAAAGGAGGAAAGGAGTVTVEEHISDVGAAVSSRAGVERDANSLVPPNPIYDRFDTSIKLPKYYTVRDALKGVNPALSDLVNLFTSSLRKHKRLDTEFNGKSTAAIISVLNKVGNIFRELLSKKLSTGKITLTSIPINQTLDPVMKQNLIQYLMVFMNNPRIIPNSLGLSDTPRLESIDAILRVLLLNHFTPAAAPKRGLFGLGWGGLGGARRTHRSRLLHTGRRLATRAGTRTRTRRRSRGLRASL